MFTRKQKITLLKSKLISKMVKSIVVGPAAFAREAPLKRRGTAKVVVLPPFVKILHIPKDEWRSLSLISTKGFGRII